MGIVSKAAKLAKKATEKARLKAAQAAARETARIKQKEQSLVKVIDTKPTEVVLGKRASNANKASEQQTSRERQVNATGKISGALTKPGNKPLSMAMYRSMSDSELDKQVKMARAGFKNGNLTKAALDEILDKVKKSQLANSRNPNRIKRAMDQGRSNKKSKVKKLDDSMSVEEKDMPKKVIKLYKGGMAKKNKKPSYNKGGYVNCGASNPGTQRK
jgi:hypothetical protein